MFYHSASLLFLLGDWIPLRNKVEASDLARFPLYTKRMQLFARFCTNSNSLSSTESLCREQKFHENHIKRCLQNWCKHRRSLN